MATHHLTRCWNLGGWVFRGFKRGKLKSKENLHWILGFPMNYVFNSQNWLMWMICLMNIFGEWTNTWKPYGWLRDWTSCWSAGQCRIRINEVPCVQFCLLFQFKCGLQDCMSLTSTDVYLSLRYPLASFIGYIYLFIYLFIYLSIYPSI